MTVSRKAMMKFGCVMLAAIAPATAWGQVAGDATVPPAAKPAATGQATSTSASPASGEDIIVTATRTETRLQDTPIAVTALSGGSLTQRNVSTLLDVAKFVPSLSIGTRAGTGTGGGAISIRGMGVNATDSSAAVGVYVDDVYFASGRGNVLGLLDVQRVEVLRGPQGTLFGRNTIAGAIQYVTQAPGKEWDGYVTGTYGSYNRHDFTGAVNIPVSDTFAMRVAGTYTKRDGYIHDDFNNVERGADETWAVRLRARWTPTDSLTVDLKGEHMEERTNGRPVLITAVNPNAQFVGLAFLFGETTPLDASYISKNNKSFPGYNAPDYFRAVFTTVNANINYELSENISLKSISSYSWYKNRLAQDFDSTPLYILGGTAAVDNTGVFTQEVQLNGKFFNDVVETTVGGYYFNSDQTKNPNQFIALGFAPAADLYGSPRTKIEAFAGYGQATINFSKEFSANLGIRYSHEKNTSYLIGVTQGVPVDFNDVSPSFGLNFKPTEDMLFYVKASRGFRAGGFVPNAALPGGGFSFDPETAWTYEAGARLEFLNHRLRFNPTVYLTNWKNIQFNRLISTPTTVAAVTDNAGDARIKGFELETQFDVTSRLQLTGSLSLMDGKYTRVDPLTYTTFPFGFLASFPDPATGAVLPGSTVVLPSLTLDTDLQQAPKVKYTIGARYTLPLASGANVVTSADFAWTDKQQSNLTLADQIEMPSYGVLSARIQYTSPNKRYSVAVFGTNLTNSFYLNGGTAFAKGYTTGVDVVDPARPREIGVDFRLNF